MEDDERGRRATDQRGQAKTNESKLHSIVIFSGKKGVMMNRVLDQQARWERLAARWMSMTRLVIVRIDRYSSAVWIKQHFICMGDTPRIIFIWGRGDFLPVLFWEYFSFSFFPFFLEFTLCLDCAGGLA